jgi:hypothetical protein
MAAPFYFDLETIKTGASILEFVIANPDVIGMWQSYTLRFHNKNPVRLPRRRSDKSNLFLVMTSIRTIVLKTKTSQFSCESHPDFIGMTSGHLLRYLKYVKMGQASRLTPTKFTCSLFDNISPNL